MLRNVARSFATQVLQPLARELDALTDPWECFQRSKPAFTQMAAGELTASLIPTEYGGAGSSCVDLAIAAEELCRVEVGVPTTLLANGLALHPIITFGTPVQKERFLRLFAEDKTGDLLACFAFTDVEGGANFDSDDPNAGVRTFARLEGDTYVINGVKHFATNGSGWERKGVLGTTRTDLSRGAKDALSIIAVPGDTSGIRVGKIENKIGLRLTVQPDYQPSDRRLHSRRYQDAHRSLPLPDLARLRLLGRPRRRAGDRHHDQGLLLGAGGPGRLRCHARHGRRELCQGSSPGAASARCPGLPALRRRQHGCAPAATPRDSQRAWLRFDDHCRGSRVPLYQGDGGESPGDDRCHSFVGGTFPPELAALIHRERELALTGKGGAVFGRLGGVGGAGWRF